MEQPPDIYPAPPSRPRATVSLPLVDATIYRPGQSVAVIVLAVPVALALVGAAVALNSSGTVPVWLPLLLLLWLPCLPILWLLMRSVRSSATSIAVGRPWQLWHEIPWTMIERVERRGWWIVIEATGGERLAFAPRLLQDGLRLYRQLLLRLPSHVLVGAMRQEAQSLIMGDIVPLPAGGFSGTLRARPRPRWPVITACLSLAAWALATAALTMLPLTPAIPLAIVGLLLGGVGLATTYWLLQEVVTSEVGLAVVSISRRTQTMRWDEVELIERGPFEAILRFRGLHRLRCVGPVLFRPAERDVLRAFIHEYCVSRKVPVVSRMWLF